MNRFVTGDGAPRTPERAEMLARVDPTLDRSVILFQDVTRDTARGGVGSCRPDRLRLGVRQWRVGKWRACRC